MTSTATQSQCASVINAADFSSKTTDVDRNEWTVGKMFHVIKALAGRKVAITVDNSTGHTEFNVTLSETYCGGGGARLVTTYSYDGGDGGIITNHRAEAIGMIMVMPTGDFDTVKSDALASYREHASAAIGIAMAEYGQTRLWGEWSARPVSGQHVMVTYTPSTENPSYADRRGEPGCWKIQVNG